MRNDDHVRQLFYKVCAYSSMPDYDELYKLLYPRLIHFSAAIVGSFQLAEEIVSDVFIAIWQKRTQLVDVRNPLVYIYVCTKNHSLTSLPRNKNNQLSFDALDNDALAILPDVEDRLTSRELARIIEHAISGLPGRCQMIFRLVKIDGFSYKDVAELLGISRKTVDAQLAIAVKKLGLSIRIHLPHFQDFLHLNPKKTNPF